MAHAVERQQVEVNISDAPTVVASNNGPICEGQTIELTATGGGSSYSWTGPNGFTSNDQSISIPNATAAQTGTYNVVVSFGSCTAEATTVVEIGNELSVNIESNSPVCDGDTLKLSVDAGTSFSWEGPNGFTSTEQYVEIPNVSLFLNIGTYSVTVSNESGCQKVLTTEVDITRPPVASTFSNGPVCLDGTILLFGNGGETYEWTGPNGYTSMEQEPVIDRLRSVWFWSEGLYIDGNLIGWLY